MVHHHIISNDLENNLEFLKGIKNREIDQKFLYFGENAREYYAHTRLSAGLTEVDSLPTYDEVLSEVMDSVVASRSTAIISIGCGASNYEKNIVQELHKKKYKVEYFGVDSSRAMLQMSEESLKKEPFKSTLILADFMSQAFIQEIALMTSKFDQRIFIFLDNTIGNISQTAAVDSLYNILSKNDVLIIEASIRHGFQKEDDLRYFKHFVSLLNIDKMVQFFLFPLKNIPVNVGDTGNLVVDTFYEDAVGALGARFHFLVTHPTTVSIRDEIVHFLPSERVKLIDLRIYNPEQLVAFIVGHDFGFQKQVLKKRRGLFSFKKF